MFLSVFTFYFQRLNGLFFCFFSKDQKYCPENLSLSSAPSAILDALHYLNLQGNFCLLNLTLPFLHLQMIVLPALSLLFSLCCKKAKKVKHNVPPYVNFLNHERQLALRLADPSSCLLLTSVFYNSFDVIIGFTRLFNQ